MLQQERHNQILAKLNLEGQVVVKELSQSFNVTEDCIRKDLTILEKAGLLKRIHGGAIQVRKNLHTINVNERLKVHSPEKRIIAKKAVELIEPGTMVFLGISTVNLEIAKYFNRQPVATVKSVVPIEEKIGIDYDSVKEYIEEMETNISLMRGMVKHLTEFKRTREEHKYQMKLIREIGFNIFDSTRDLEKVVNTCIQ